ncbi:MAG: hypothetical protein HKN76_03400 [Saprospiraceae bacterium]|nr:hypothetical protein [Saprospiraceae bacterium]
MHRNIFRFFLANRNGLILFSLLIVLTAGATLYYESGKMERLYQSYSLDLTSQLPVMRIRSNERSDSQSNTLDYALATEDFDLALTCINEMQRRDTSNMTLVYYDAILREKQQQYLQSITSYQRVRFNSQLFDTAALRRLVLLYLKLNEEARAVEMLTELNIIGTAQDQLWVKELISQL